MDLPNNLKDEIWDYCRINSITNIDEFTLKLIKTGFTVEKYGATPQVIEKKIEVEKIIEVPVEKIVEKIVEIQVDKEVYVSDNLEMKKLTEEIAKLNLTIKTITEDKNNLLEKVSELNTENEKIKTELQEEKKKKKTDIYGE